VACAQKWTGGKEEGWKSEDVITGRRHRCNVENLSCYKGTGCTWNRNNSHSFVLASTQIRNTLDSTFLRDRKRGRDTRGWEAI